MHTLKAVGVGLLTGVAFWMIFYGVFLWQLWQLQKHTPAGLGAVSDAWAGPGALVGFVLGFIWRIRR